MMVGLLFIACFTLAFAQQAPQQCPSDVKAMIAPPKRMCSPTNNMCPDTLLCCPCQSGASYCVHPEGTDEATVKRLWDEYLQSKYDDDDCDDSMEHDDDDDDDDDHHHHPHPENKGDEHDKMHKRRRCHDKHHHRRRKIHAIVGGTVGVALLVAIVVTVTCLVRRRRRRMSKMERKRSYIQSTIVTQDKAPLPPNMASAPVLTKEELKATLGTDFTPTV